MDSFGNRITAIIAMTLACLQMQDDWLLSNLIAQSRLAGVAKH
jgi:hypothetical protein